MHHPVVKINHRVRGDWLAGTLQGLDDLRAIVVRNVVHELIGRLGRPVTPNPAAPAQCSILDHAQGNLARLYVGQRLVALSGLRAVQGVDQCTVELGKFLLVAVAFRVLQGRRHHAFDTVQRVADQLGLLHLLCIGLVDAGLHAQDLVVNAR